MLVITRGYSLNTWWMCSTGHVFYLLHITQRFTGKRAVLAFVDLAAPIAVRRGTKGGTVGKP